MDVAAAALLAAAAHPAWAEPSPPAAQSAPSAEDIVISPELGAVLKTHQPFSATAPTIIHIQDTRAGYEAQKQLAAILEQLIAAHQLRLILVEGSEGDVGLSGLRQYGPSTDRQAAAEKYLKTGLISGEEYLDLSSDYPIVLWGVDELSLYRRNVSAFQEAQQLQRMLEPVLAEVRDTLDQLKPVRLTRELEELERKRARFQERRVSLAEYAAFLESMAAKHEVPVQAYPALTQHAALSRLEQGIELEDIPQEQRALMERLGARGSAKAMDRVIELSEGLRTGETAPQAFYAELKRLAKEQRIRLETYPNLARYIDYVTRRAEQDTAALAKELDALAGKLAERLTAAVASQGLSGIGEELSLIERLVQMRLSSEEYERFRALALPGLFTRWVQVLNHHRQQAGLPAKPFQGLSLVEAGLPTLQRFHDVCRERDVALVDNTLRKLKMSQSRIAVLITGDFHSPAIAETLKARGLGIVEISPR